MIEYHFHPTPNPMKVALFLEESGIPYKLFPIDTSRGEPHSAAFRQINTNGKAPAIVDSDGAEGATRGFNARQPRDSK